MLQRLMHIALVAGVVFAATPAAEASKGVARTLTGCVVDNAFYSVDGRAYRIGVPASLDLRPFEGKGVRLRGMLYPGDRFVPADDATLEVTQAVCPRTSLRLIKRDVVIGFRVEATKAAEAGEHALAIERIGQAMAVLTPPDCDTFTDRAQVMALHGDVAAAAKDIATIQAKKCVIDGRMNPLLLQDLGNTLRAKGDRRSAIAALQLALVACDGDWCRPQLKRDLATARK
ncbi:MAG: hypothetical protein H0T89_27640 [Deltaproteobacteria bacterium]|nr:hypothetical protein [Deltaproteobacteria bacterium]MDQ3297485.1 hypothetical protein [Myxococcota bacterium]